MSPVWSGTRAYSAITAVVALTVATACSGSGHHAAPPTHTATVPATGGTSTTPGLNPELAVGRTIRVELSASDVPSLPPGSAEVTLTGKKAATSIAEPDLQFTPSADPGKQFICLKFKIKNVGTGSLDVFPFSQATWTGRNGETTQAGGVLEVDCKYLGLPGDDINSVPSPQPGQFVQGTTIFEVSNTQPGTLQFTDRAQIPMFTIRTDPVS